MTSRSLRLIAAALAVLATPSGDNPVVQAQAAGTNPPAIFSDPDRRSKLSGAFPEIDRQVAALMERTHLPGAAWGIVIDGELAHVGVAGQRDLASKAPVTRDSIFRIASMTKSFTAMAIMKLRDDGRLSLDDLAETVRAGTERPDLSDVGLAPHHRSSSALARRGVPGRQSMGRPAACCYRGAVQRDVAKGHSILESARCRLRLLQLRLRDPRADRHEGFGTYRTANTSPTRSSALSA